MENTKKTSLYDAHVKLGGQIVDFAGWALPIKYDNIKEEHEAVRNNAGIFDVSHMGEVTVKGEEAEKFVDYLTSNNIVKLNENQIAYGMMCYEDGGVVDDLLVYKFSKFDYYLVINASNIEKDFAWIRKYAAKFNVEVKNISSEVSEIAIQGPKAQEILQKITDIDLNEINFFYLKDEVTVFGKKCLVSRTGYTGEDGFEIYLSNDDAIEVWNKLLEVGKDLGIKPAGLGCRDTLRFEVALPLYGQELSKDISPLEAGLGFFVKLEAGDFIGRDALIKQKTDGIKRKIVGFQIEKGGIPRHGYEVVSDGIVIGEVTTGYLSPTTGEKIGLALLDSEYSEIGTKIGIKNRKKVYDAVVRGKKFYNKKYK